MANIEVITQINDLLDANDVTIAKTALGVLGAATTGNASIVAADLAANAVTTVKIADANVTSGKLATGAAVGNIVDDTLPVAKVTGTLPVAKGGTGAATASTARTNILPSFTGNGGKVLAVNAGASDVEYIAANATGVIVTKTNGTRTNYPPSADTDTARGLALVAAFAAAVAGDTIDLSSGNYLITKDYSGTVGGFVADFAILDGMTIKLNGARLYRTVPSTVTSGAFVIGKHYTITTAGDTNFVSEQGAANNNGGTSFVAIATGTGTGTAILTPPVMFAVAHVTASMGGSNWSLIGPGIIEGTAATTTTTGYTNEIGLNVNASRAWKIDGVSFRKFRGTGLQLNSANFTGDATGYSVTYKVSTGHISNCNFDLNNVGMACYAGNEYSAFINCTFNQNLTGADIYAGNTKFLGCEASDNTNFALRIRNGGNDGHGCWVGGWITHNAGFAVSVEASMDLGFIFTGTTFGANSVTTNKIQSLGGGLNFVACYMESPFFASATPTGNNFMSGCFISGTYTVHTDLSTAERLKWKFVNNQTLSGPWVSNDAYAYLYADNNAALAGGLLAGEEYRTSAGDLRIVV